MSLTSHLKDAHSPVRQYLEGQFPHTRGVVVSNNTRLREATVILPAAHASPYPYSIVGMALDYRLRYYWAMTPGEETVAWLGAMDFAAQMEIGEEPHHPQYGYATRVMC